MHRSLVLAVTLAVLFCAAAQAYVCDAPDYWSSQFKVKNGQISDTANKNFASIAWTKISKTLKYANDENELMAGTCTVTKLTPFQACYKSWAAVDGKQLKGQYGFAAKAALNCPYPPFKSTKNVEVTVFTRRDGTYWASPIIHWP